MGIENTVTVKVKLNLRCGCPDDLYKQGIEATCGHAPQYTDVV